MKAEYCIQTCSWKEFQYKIVRGECLGLDSEQGHNIGVQMHKNISFSFLSVMFQLYHPSPWIP